MNCPNCKMEIPDNTFVCPHCNTLILEESEDNSENYTCPICGQENPQGERKCQYCCSIF